MFSQSQSHISISELTDEELVEQFSQTKDNKLFGVLYKRYAHLVFGSALKYMKDHELAKDMVAQVFEKLYKKLPEVTVQNFKSYLYGSIRNECIAKLRQIKSEREKTETYKLDEKKSDLFMENDGLIRLIDNAVSVEDKIAEAMKQLSEEQRFCVNLFFFQNKSYKEIVEMTDFDLKQVKSYLQNGKRNLRNVLEPMLNPPA